MNSKINDKKNEERSIGNGTSTNLPKPDRTGVAQGSLGGKTKTEVNTTGKKGK